jgi:hypothetical protein
MNCFNDEQIQHYIDGEISDTDLKLFELHLKTCNICKEKVIEQKENKKLLLKLFDSVENNQTTSIPPFNYKNNKPKRIGIKRLLLIASAASLLFITYFFLAQQKKEKQSIISSSSTNFEFDANSSITNQEFEITITDNKGNAVEYYIK